MNNPIRFTICIILQAVTIKSFSKLLKKPIKSNTPGVGQIPVVLVLLLILMIFETFRSAPSMK